MFGIGMSEMVVILAIALLVFGPNKLPEIAKQLAKGLKEIRKAGDDLKANLNFDLDDDRPRPQFRPPPQAAPQRPVEVPPNIPGSTVADQLPVNPGDPAPPTTPAAPMTEPEQWPKPAEGAVAQGSESAANGRTPDEPKA